MACRAGTVRQGERTVRTAPQSAPCPERMPRGAVAAEEQRACGIRQASTEQAAAARAAGARLRAVVLAAVFGGGAPAAAAAVGGSRRQHGVSTGKRLLGLCHVLWQACVAAAEQW